MNYPTSVSLNGVVTDLPDVLQCELVTSIYEDLGETEIALHNDDLSAESVRTFFEFVLDDSVLTKGNMHELLKVWNYLGCSETMLTALRLCYDNTKSDYNSFLVWRHWPCGKTIKPPVDLNATDYNKLVDMGYTDEQLTPYLWKGVSVEYFPDEGFKKQFNIASALVEILDRQPFRKDCFVAGGFLTSCMSSTPRVENHQDIDIFCLNGMHNVLIEALMERYTCKCFTALNVTTILVRYSSRPIQIIACAESTYQEVLYDFDLPCCKIAYYDGKFMAMADFHRALATKSFTVSGRVNRARVAKYTRREFSIDTSYAELYGHDNTTISDNRYYKWTDETDDRLLYLVKLLFSEFYEHTKLPIPTPSFGWKKAYEGVDSCNSNQLRIVEKFLPNGVKIVTLLPSKPTTYYLTGVTGAVAERCKEVGDNKLVFKLRDTNQLSVIGKSLLDDGSYTTRNVWNATSGLNKNRPSLPKLGVQHVIPSSNIATKYSWLRLLDGNEHTVNMAVKPVCYVFGQIMRVVFECVDVTIA